MSKSDNEVVEVSLEEWRRLQGEDMLRKLEVQLEQRVRRRFSLILVAVAVLSFFGIQGLASVFISQQLAPEISRAKDAAATANAEAALVSSTIEEVLRTSRTAKTEAETALKTATAQTEKVNDLLATLNARADNLDVRFSSINARSENVRTQLELSVEKIEARIFSIVEQLPTAQPTINALSQQTEEELDEFKENSNVELWFTKYGNTEIQVADALVQHFKRLGFKVIDNLQASYRTNENSTDRVRISYGKSGETKLGLIVDDLEMIFGISAITEFNDSPTLAGDIQVGFISVDDK